MRLKIVLTCHESTLKLFLRAFFLPNGESSYTTSLVYRNRESEIYLLCTYEQTVGRFIFNTIKKSVVYLNLSLLLLFCIKKTLQIKKSLLYAIDHTILDNIFSFRDHKNFFYKFLCVLCGFQFVVKTTMKNTHEKLAKIKCTPS